MTHFSIEDVFKGFSFTPAETTVVEGKFKTLHLKKGDTLLSAGQLVPYQYYVAEGCLRAYYIADTGKEFTLQFAVQDWWISDYTAFFAEGHAVLHIDCVYDAVVHQISKASMEQLYKEVPQIESFYRIKMERFFASFQRRILSDLALSAKEKYASFLKTYPNIEKHIKNYHLASYLGITTESLSRIRKDLAKGK